jgi:hypothetical protein
MSSNIFANVVVQGTITSVGTYGQTTYAPVDLGVNSLSLATGNLTSLITTSSSAPSGLAAAGEGSLVFPGTANAYISFGTTGQPFSNSNIYAFGDFVVEAWVNPTSLSNNPYVLGFGDPSAQGQYYWQIQLFSTALSWISYLNSVVSSATAGSITIPTGSWSHIAVIHQSASKRVQVYLNGQPQTFTASAGGFTTAGTVATYTTGIVPVTGQQLSVGQLYNPTFTYTGSLTNLRITTGSGAAQIYNNNAFTPSTSPLFPASNTTGGSLTTRLLVRVPLAKNQTNFSKIGPASGALMFPPAPLTTYMTYLTGLSYYGQGKYVASASSDLSGNQVWNAFYGPTSYVSATGTYSLTAPYGYLGSNVTVDVSGNSYAGEWFQLQLPVAIVPTSVVGTGSSSAGPSTMWTLGSRDGTNWTLIDYRTGLSSSVNLSLTCSQSFNYFRWVVNSVIASVGWLQINAYWRINGSIESVNVTTDGRVGVGVVAPTRALEVAGDVVCGGTLSAGNPLMFRNRVINGDFRIDQRAGGTSNTQSAGGISYGSADRWATFGRLTSKFSVQQSSVVPPGLGFSNSLLVTSLSAYVPVTSDYYGIAQKIEGYNMADFMWASSYGVPATLSFWVRSSVTGNYTFNAQGGTATSPSFSVQYNIGAANSWQQIVIVIPPPPSNYSANFVTTNGPGMRLWWDLGSSDTTYATSTPGAWVTGDKVRVSGSVNFVSTNGATMYITGVQLEKGTVATPFEVRPYGVELQLCQRYYQKSYNIATAPGTATESGNYTFYSPVTVGIGNNLIQSGPALQVSMRAAPTIVLYTAAGAVSTVWNALDGSTATTWRYLNNISGVSQSAATNYSLGWTAAAEL